jgi:hypothetical protein
VSAAAPLAVETLNIYIKAERKLRDTAALTRQPSVFASRGQNLQSAAFGSVGELVETISLAISASSKTRTRLNRKIGALYTMADRPLAYLNVGVARGEQKAGGFGQCTPMEILVCAKHPPNNTGSYRVTETVMMLKAPVSSSTWSLEHEAFMLYYANSVEDALVRLCRDRSLPSTSIGHPALPSCVSLPPYVVRIHHYLPEQVLSPAGTAAGANGSVPLRHSDGLLLQLHSTSLRALLPLLVSDADKLVIMQRMATVLRFLSVHCKMVHGDFHVAQVLVDVPKGYSQRPAYEAMVLCDLGNSVVEADKRDFLHGVSSTRTPDPIGLATFRDRKTGRLSSPDVLHQRVQVWSATHKESRLRCSADDWWGFYITCHRVVDAPELKDKDKYRVLIWDKYHPSSGRESEQVQNKLHNVKSECLFGSGCKTRRGVEAALSTPTPWRMRPALLPAFRDALEAVFRILVEAELSQEGFTNASADAICAILAQTRLPEVTGDATSALF